MFTHASVNNCTITATPNHIRSSLTRQMLHVILQKLVRKKLCSEETQQTAQETDLDLAGIICVCYTARLTHICT